jgi:superfamily II DNA or RNA helicase
MAQGAPEADGAGWMNPWPHQIRAVSETLAAINAGIRRICVTSPTGGGKTYIASELIRHYLERGMLVVLYTNRKLLVAQTSRVLEAAGHVHGVRAAGYDDDRHRELQVSSIQTEGSRVLRGQRWGLHEADLVIVDEAHLNAGKTARTILDAHREQGASIVGLTATPIDLGDMYDCLVVAGTNSELRACGALVPCLHYGPDEPDLRHIGKVALGENLTEKQNVRAIMTPAIWSNVLAGWKRYNPDARPTILFGPGVGESLWFAEQFWAAGISAAHIDGADVWVNGKLYRTSQSARDDVLDGSIRVICNRFVLREGIDAPWLSHGIFAAVFGSLQSYLQSGGRLLRASPRLSSVTIQDHGGNWHRHGSLNADRTWNLQYTAGMIAGLRQEQLRCKRCRRCKAKLTRGPVCPQCGLLNEFEPVRCPKCQLILNGYRCRCSYEIAPGKKSRPVIQHDGSLKEMKGDIFKPRRISLRADAEKVWERMYYRAKNKGMTFRQAEALYSRENNYLWPSHEMPLMPRDPLDWFKKVIDVPVERLTPKKEV